MTDSSTVYLAIYDLSRGMASQMSPQFLGQQIEAIYHTGIRCFNKEFYFGGGIQCSPIGFFERNSGLMPMRLQNLGRTNKTEMELRTYINSITSQWTAASYNLLTHNCNNFSDTIAKFLLQRGIPEDIVGLPERVFSTPIGQMLRPIIDGMQRGIQADNSHTIDPFGGGFIHGNTGSAGPFPVQPAANYGSSFDRHGSQLGYTASSNTPTYVSNAPARPIQDSRAITITRAKLDETFFVSSQLDGVDSMLQRLRKLTQPSDSSSDALLSDTEAAILDEVSTWIKGASCSVPEGAYKLLTKLATTYSQAQTPALFLLRVLFSKDSQLKLGSKEYIQSITPLILTLASQLERSHSGHHANASAGFVPLGNVSAMVMSLCSLSNWTSAVPDLNTPFQIDPSLHMQALVDAVTYYMSSERVELRQISSALAYNITLHNTQQEKLSTAWGGIEIGEIETHVVDLHAHAVQFLCCLEGISQETDAIARKRKLSMVLRILRACGPTAVSFIRDLGFETVFPTLLARLPMTSAPAADDERTILQDLIHSTRSVVSAEPLHAPTVRGVPIV